MMAAKSWESRERTASQVCDGNRYLGWTLEQWAIAAGRYPEYAPRDFQGHARFSDAQKLMVLWSKLNYANPGEILLAGVDLPRCWDYAIAVFQIGMHEGDGAPGPKARRWGS